MNVCSPSNSAHWLAMSHGAVSQSMPIATAYDTLGQEGLQHSLVQTGSKAIFCDPHLLKQLINPLKQARELQYVIYNTDGEVKKEHIEELKSTHGHLTILSFAELQKSGEDNPVDPVPPQPEDLCCIMYTSGSTGTPKGVPIKHKAVLASSEYLSSFLSASSANQKPSCRRNDHYWPVYRARGRYAHLPSPSAYLGIRL